MHDPAFLAGQVFNGLSVASIYVLAALGLALSFGLMRVINMAHGEIVMFGGYIAYMVMQVVHGPLGIPWRCWRPSPAAASWAPLLQVTLVSRMAERPLDTLLATWGVSLIAQQAARDLFGATGVSVTAPSWMDGAGHDRRRSPADHPPVHPAGGGPGAGRPGAVHQLTRVGLLVRAVNQDRPTASAMGVSVKGVDMLVFALGAAVAGVAGVVLALLGPVTPSVGQSYIVTASWWSSSAGWAASSAPPSPR
ncbi:MAG: hypothetical protein WDN45_15700 [Caulobacteraceae bacterium]